MLLLWFFVTCQVSAIEVITHPHVIDNNLTKSQLRRIYTMRQLRWSDNSAITVFVLPSQHSLHQRFAKEQLQIFPYQLNRIWHKLTYSGLGVAPTVVESEQALIAAVINTPGAIGYLEDMTLAQVNSNKNKAVTSEIAGVEQAPVMEKKQQERVKGVVNVVTIKD